MSCQKGHASLDDLAEQLGEVRVFTKKNGAMDDLASAMTGKWTPHNTGAGAAKPSIEAMFKVQTAQRNPMPKVNTKQRNAKIRDLNLDKMNLNPGVRDLDFGKMNLHSKK